MCCPSCQSPPALCTLADLPSSHLWPCCGSENTEANRNFPPTPTPMPTPVDCAQFNRSPLPCPLLPCVITIECSKPLCRPLVSLQGCKPGECSKKCLADTQSLLGQWVLCHAFSLEYGPLDRSSDFSLSPSHLDLSLSTLLRCFSSGHPWLLH